jgi:predicted nucleotidyltransferase
MLNQTNIIKKVELFTSELLKKGIELDKVILFGSYAKNMATDYSDIDVALVSGHFTGFGFEDKKHFSNINNKPEFIDIETKTFSTDYYAQNDPLIVEINKTGIIIYENHQNY